MELSEPQRVSPLLDGFVLGGAISEHHGVTCYPAIEESTGQRYILKIISIPASQSQVDALLLTGACSDREQVQAYYQDLTDGVAGETDKLEQLSKNEGFVPYVDKQILPKENEIGFDVYLLSKFTPSLQVVMHTKPLTHLAAVNLGLDICAALAACRRMGCLYVDLKPENIFPSETQGYRIGDLGFLPLSSLKYASLPEKYRSSYTAPEVSDALSTLNDTMDVYALGLILYQVYNNGQLPVATDEGIPAPLYADYEMAEIILKACAADPADRWQDPVQMGQALVDYMQRNSVNDEPVIPAPVVIDEPEETQEGFISEEENDEELAELLALIPDEEPPVQLTISEAMVPDEAEEDARTQEDVAAEEEVDETDEEQLSFLNDDLTLMLAQADDLIAHELPEPVIAPAPIDVPVPVVVADEPQEPETTEEETTPIAEAEPEAEAEDAEEDEDALFEMPMPPSSKPPISRGWITAAVAVLLAVLVFAGISVWYQNFYIQRVDSFEINCHSGNVYVAVYSDIDEETLHVICTDTYGNALRSPVENGVAIFSDLKPATQYRFRLEINGFHKLEGPTTGTYTTDNETKITDFTASCGPEDCSVTLQFNVTGPDSENWIIHYSAAGIPEQTQLITGHKVTIYDLSPDSEYTFLLVSGDGISIVGNTQITYTARNILTAEDLAVTFCGNGSLSVAWKAENAPAGQKWIVRCYNNAGYDKTLTTDSLSCEFTGLDHTKEYTVQIIAEGMTRTAELQVPADPITVTAFNTDRTDLWTMVLSWEFTGNAPADGWTLLCSIDAGDEIRLQCQENSAQISLTPGRTYAFWLEGCYGETFTYGPVEVPYFEGFGVTADDIELDTVKRPSKVNWSYTDLTDADRRSEFTAGELVSVLAHVDLTYNVSDKLINVTYLLRDGNNQAVSTDTQSITWRNLWYQRYCELDLPTVPDTAGTYSVDIYFNEMYIGSVHFSVI